MSIDSIITLIGAFATIASTIYTIIQTRKAKEYKEKTYRLYLSLDKSMLAERCSQLTIEISNTSGSINNNKGGKLSSLFTRLNTLMNDIQKFAARNELQSISELLQLKDCIINFIISERDKASVDITFLSRKMNEVDIIIQRVCGNVLNEID